MDILEDLRRRGLVEQIIDEEGLVEKLNSGMVTYYFGTDPTADSMHVGHLVGMNVVSLFQKYGHRPIILVGGATGHIGDPSGKQELRKMLTKEDIENNKKALRKQLEKLVSFEGENAAIMVDNADWTSDVKYLDYLRDVGIHFNVNNMLKAECYAARLKEGLTFLELGYMLIQANDFKHLYETEGCIMQIGGNDQWSNQIAGVDLIRKVHGVKTHALSVRLITNKDGKKMGKTEKGALWLDANKTTPFEFYQYLRNIDDTEIEKVFKMVSVTDIEKIERILEEEKDPNKLKEILAFDITSRIHGKEAAEEARQTAKDIFSGKVNTDALPEVKVEIGENILDVCINAGFGTSRGQIKKLVADGGITLGDKKIEVGQHVKEEDLKDGNNVLRKGKKTVVKLV